MFKHSTPIPTDEDLNYVHPTPTKLIHPSLSADKVYHLLMKEKIWKSWSEDSFGVTYYKKDYESGINSTTIDPFDVDVKGVALSLRDRMIVRDRKTKVPVAVILQMHLKWETTFKIYGFTPYYEGQIPSENQKHDTKDLYEWASVKDKFFSIQKKIKMIDEKDEYVMDAVGPIITGYRQLRLTRNGKVCCHFIEKNIGLFKGNQWEMKIGKGVDPCLIIAFMAIRDEMDEE